MDTGSPQSPPSPLLSDSPAVWDELIESVGPASMLVLIGARMSAELRSRLAPEDLWQETLLCAWRDRERCQWQGVRAFRHWLLTIADHRIADAAEREGAQKRGGGKQVVLLSQLEGSSTGASAFPLQGMSSTSPSRLATLREQAELMHAALAGLSEDVREVVRLRLFEELTMDEVAVRLDLGLSAAKHRFRKGAADYQRRLASALASRSRS